MDEQQIPNSDFNSFATWNYDMPSLFSETVASSEPEQTGWLLPSSEEPNTDLGIKSEYDFSPSKCESSPIFTPDLSEDNMDPTDKRKNSKRKIANEQVVNSDDKYVKRLAANKKSAQASRERKKALKSELEDKLKHLQTENSRFATEITELETENKVLKNEFIHLHKLINDSPVFSKLLARSNMQLPPPLEVLPNPKLGDEIPRDVSPEKQMAASLFLVFILNSFASFLPQTNPHIANAIKEIQAGIRVAQMQSHQQLVM